MDIVKAVNKRIKQVFNTEDIYNESSSQGINPGFSVFKVENPMTRLVSNVFSYEPIINIVYTPTEENLQTLEDMESQMLDALEYLYVGESLIRGYDLSSTIIDDTISMTVTYPYTLRKNKHSEIVNPIPEDIIGPIDPGKDNPDSPISPEEIEKEKLDPDMDEEIDFMRRLYLR